MRIHIALPAALALALGTTIASAQIKSVGLPEGESLPTEWVIASSPAPAPPTWSAVVSYQVTNPSPNVYTYWYKVEHTGAGTGQGLMMPPPPPQKLKSFSLDSDPLNFQIKGGIYQFGQYETWPGNQPGQSIAAEDVYNGDSSLRWSHFAGFNQPYHNGLTAGETVVLWTRSELPPYGMSVFSLQNGYIAQTMVPTPAVPEPGSLLILGAGVAGLAVKRFRFTWQR